MNPNKLNFMPKSNTKVSKKMIKMVNPKPFKKSLAAKSTIAKKIAPSKAEVLRTSPKDVFLHLLMLVMLYLGVISLISLAFAYIDYTFPDPLSYDYGSGLLSNIRWQSSMLIVSFPLLLILSRFIQKEFRNNPKKHELRFYKWLTYLTLFVSAITIVIDLIELVNRFYGGELTTPFVLKVISVLVVAGAVFGYYIWDVQTEAYKSKVPYKVGWATSVAVVFMIVLGFVLAGSPSHQRQVRMDEQRVNDLSNIQYQVINYWQVKRDLPESLNQLVNSVNYFNLPVDPETGISYEYLRVDDLNFELCANFNQKSFNDTSGDRMISKPIYNYDYGYPSEQWTHEEGRVCFQRNIDPELYPKTN